MIISHISKGSSIFSNGVKPPIISYKNIPSPQRSDWNVLPYPQSISGGQYVSRPHKVWVLPFSTNFENLKFVKHKWPS